MKGLASTFGANGIPNNPNKPGNSFYTHSKEFFAKDANQLSSVEKSTYEAIGKYPAAAGTNSVYFAAEDGTAQYFAVPMKDILASGLNVSGTARTTDYVLIIYNKATNGLPSYLGTIIPMSASRARNFITNIVTKRTSFTTFAGDPEDLIFQDSIISC